MIDLKAFRKANHLTQIDLAEYLGVGQGFISQIEKGDRPLPKEYISRLSANPHNWDTSMLKSDQPENPMEEQPSSNSSLIDYLQRKVAELEGKIDKLNEEKADLLQENAVLKYENQLLAPQKGRNAEDAESSLSVGAAR
jgi:transcriptional regulator with XRE-family HTH domain